MSLGCKETLSQVSKTTIATVVREDGVWYNVAELVSEEEPVPMAPGDPERVPQPKYRDLQLPPAGAKYDDPDSLLHPDEVGVGYRCARQRVVLLYALLPVTWGYV